MNLMHTLQEPVAWTDIWGQLGRITALFKTLAIMGPFMYRANPSSCEPRVLEYARAMKKVSRLRSEFVPSLRSPGGLRMYTDSQK